MSIRRISAIVIRQFFLFKSNPVRLISVFLWPFLSILQWGFVTKYLSSLGEDTFSFITVILGAVILYEFMTRIMNGVMTTFLEDVWSKNFFNIFSSPITIEEYCTGLIFSTIITGFFNFIFISILAGILFKYNILKLCPALFLFLFNLFIFGVALGLFITSIIFKMGPAAEWIGWPLPFVLSIISGVFYPVSTLPKFLQIIAKFFPTSYIFESMRKIVLENFDFSFSFNMRMSFILSSLFLILNFYFFIRVYKNNLKTGAIARFTAFE